MFVVCQLVPRKTSSHSVAHQVHNQEEQEHDRNTDHDSYVHKKLLGDYRQLLDG